MKLKNSFIIVHTDGIMKVTHAHVTKLIEQQTEGRILFVAFNLSLPALKLQTMLDEDVALCDRVSLCTISDSFMMANLLLVVQKHIKDIHATAESLQCQTVVFIFPTEAVFSYINAVQLTQGAMITRPLISNGCIVSMKEGGELKVCKPEEVFA